jgi:hypothetical protein
MGLTLVNVIGAKHFGWAGICHLCEDTFPKPVEGINQIQDLNELRDLYPLFFIKNCSDYKE